MPVIKLLTFVLIILYMSPVIAGKISPEIADAYKTIQKALPRWKISGKDHPEKVKVDGFQGYRIVVFDKVANFDDCRNQVIGSGKVDIKYDKYYLEFFIFPENGKKLPVNFVKRIPWNSLHYPYYCEETDLGSCKGFHWYGNIPLYYVHNMKSANEFRGGADPLLSLIKGLKIKDKGTCTRNSVIVCIHCYGKRAIPYLEEIIENGSQAERWYTALALAKIPGGQTSKLLVGYYFDNNCEISSAAKYALRNRPYRKSAKAAYFDMLKNQSSVAEPAAACKEFMWKDAVPLLQRICDHPTGLWNYCYAYDALRYLTGNPVNEDYSREYFEIIRAARENPKKLGKLENELIQSGDADAGMLTGAMLLLYLTKDNSENIRRVNESGKRILRHYPRKKVIALLKKFDTDPDNQYFKDFLKELQSSAKR